MASRKTQFGWMALGCLVGLLGVVVIHKMEGERAIAQTSPPLHSDALPPKHPEHGHPDAKLPAADIALPPPPGVAEPVPQALPPIAAAEKVPALSSAPSIPLPPPAPAFADLPPPQPGIALPTNVPVAGGVVKVDPPPSAIPEPAPAGPSSPRVEAKVDAVPPPPLPTADSLPPPSNDLKPIPIPLTPLGDPLPSLPVETANKKEKVAPASKHAAEIIPATFTPAPPPPASSQPVPVDPPAGTPLPLPVAVPALDPMTKATPSVEPPLAPSPGPVVSYQVRAGGETMREIARRTLGGEDHWAEIHRLNPTLQPDAVISSGATVKLPADACIHDDDTVQPLPAMRPKAVAEKSKAALPLTGTFAGNLDDKKALLLPRAIRDQLGNCETLLVSPGSDQCLWLTNQTHLDRLADRLEHSPARELDVRTFRRLYFAQTEKAAVGDDGRVTVPDKLALFAGLHQEVVLVGIDDHFELWDAAKWRQYTQQKSAAARAAMVDRD